MKKKSVSVPTIHIARKAAGDFSASALLDITLKAENMWSDGVQANEFKSNAEAAVAVATNQTARFQVLDDPDHDRQVRVSWISACDLEDRACVEECTIDEPELETKKKYYSFDMCREFGFSVNRERLRTNDYTREELAAQGMAKAIKKLDEWWAKQILLKLKAFQGPNVAPSPWTYDAANTTTNVPTSEYNLKMIGNLIQQAMLNQMNSPYWIEKGDLFVPYWNARIENGNADGKGDAARTQAIDMYFDMFNFSKAGITEDLFAIDRSAIAFKTYTRYQDAPQVQGGNVQQTWYNVPSQKIPGVKYMVTYQMGCKIVEGKKSIYDQWVVRTEGGIWSNPEACPVIGQDGTTSYTQTGIMSYSKTV